MTGKCGCYRSPASTDTTFPAERSSYAQPERALLSAPTCTLTHTAATRGLLSSPIPTHPAASSCPPAHPHHCCCKAGCFSRQLKTTIQRVKRPVKKTTEDPSKYREKICGFHDVGLSESIHPAWAPLPSH